MAEMMDCNDVTTEDIQGALDYCCKYLIYTYINKLQMECKKEEIVNLFVNFINNFDLGCVISKNNNFGTISMYESLKKVSEETELFDIDVKEEKPNNKVKAHH